MRCVRHRNTESAGNEVLHLEVGQPGTLAPAGARAAAIAAIGTATLGYTAALGTPELRARIVAAGTTNDTSSPSIPAASS
ncbi:MAG: hypothetical protein R2710_29165 [Acidimicrobiales bacterium]